MDAVDSQVNVNYRLRRIGEPSTTSVPDFMRLEKAVTHFGRHSESDIVIDSSELPQLISRNHAEIERTEGSGGPQFVVRNKGLNGTYVNDIRINADTILDPGDTVQFGHINAISIKPGEVAERFTNEFIFRFEREEEPDMIVGVKSEYPDSPILLPLDHHGKPAGSQETPGIGGQSGSATSRKIFDSPTGATVLKDIGNHVSRSSPGKCLVHLDDLVNNPACSDQTVKVEKTPLLLDTTADQAVYNTAIRAAAHFQDSEEDIFAAIPRSGPLNFATGRFEINSTYAGTHASPMDMDSPSNSSCRSVGSVQKRRGRPPKKLTPSVPSPLTSQAPPAAKAQPPKKIEKRKRKSSTSAHKKKKPQTAATGSPSDNTDDQRCDSDTCLRPRGSTVDWVQCDDCDSWYHTACAGCSYEDVKDETSQFHCGCV